MINTTEIDLFEILDAAAAEPVATANPAPPLAPAPIGRTLAESEAIAAYRSAATLGTACHPAIERVAVAALAALAG